MDIAKIALTPSYHETLEALKDADLGRALILARNGLKKAEANDDALNLSAHQGLFARIHFQDEDPASARRALKLMKLHLEKLSGPEREWADAEYGALIAPLEAKP